MYSGLHFMRGSRKGSDNSRKIEKKDFDLLPLPPPQTIYPPHPLPMKNFLDPRMHLP